MKNIKVIHSFPEAETKFKEYCRLTFEIEELHNTYVANLSEVENLNDFDLIVIHYLRIEDCAYLATHNVQKPMVWFCWGADIFDQGKFKKKFLLQKTLNLKRKMYFREGFKEGLEELIFDIFPFAKDYSKISQTKLKALEKIDYMVPVMPGDYALIQENYNLKPALHHLNYVSPLVESESFEGISGNNILLGNSSTFTNNHLEAIDQLKQLDLGDRKVIIPLSYGNQNLAEYIKKYAYKKLGNERVVILKDFIPFSEYNQILNSCEILIMNHMRQQAVGNIVQGLLNGAHIYLREESTVYQYLREYEFKVSSFNDVEKVEGLKEKEILFNRAKAKEVFGAKTQHQKLLSLIEKALNT